MQRMRIPFKSAKSLYPFIGESHQLRGLPRHTTVFRVGKWRIRMGVGEIVDECRARAFNFIDLGEEK